jgi:PAS domain S-box-containing protein
VAIALFCLGAALSSGLFFDTRGREREDLARQFLKEVQDRVSAIKRTMELDATIVASVGRFYDASNEVDRGEFRVFAEPLLVDHPSLRALEWAPRVPESKRAQFEAAAREDGCADYRITQYDEQGFPSPAPGRNDYYPVFYRAVRAERVGPMGSDLAAEPECREAMHRSASTGRLVSALTTASRESGRSSLRLFLPVYRKNVPLETAEDRRKNLEGFVVGVLRPHGILEEGLSTLSPGGLDVGLLDLSAPRGRQLLAWWPSRVRGSDAAPGDPESVLLESPLRRLAVIEIGGRQWGIACVPVPGFIAKHITWRPWVGGLGVLVIAVLLAGYLVGQKLATRAVEQERAKLSAMISGMEEGVVFADADNAIVEVNEYLCRFLNKRREEIVGRRIEDFHAGEALERILRQIDEFRNQVGARPWVFQRPLGGAEVILRMQPI